MSEYCEAVAATWRHKTATAALRWCSLPSTVTAALWKFFSDTPRLCQDSAEHWSTYPTSLVRRLSMRLPSGAMLPSRRLWSLLELQLMHLTGGITDRCITLPFMGTQRLLPCLRPVLLLNLRMLLLTVLWERLTSMLPTRSSAIVDYIMSSSLMQTRCNYHCPEMRRRNTFGRICLSVCLSCSGSNFCKCWHFLFDVLIHLERTSRSGSYAARSSGSMSRLQQQKGQPSISKCICRWSAWTERQSCFEWITVVHDV